jgi:hypothetical protein
VRMIWRIGYYLLNWKFKNRFFKLDFIIQASFLI